MWFRFLGLWRCSETKRAYVPTIHIRKMLYNNDFRAWGLFEGSPDESDRIWPKREETAYLGIFGPRKSRRGRCGRGRRAITAPDGCGETTPACSLAAEPDTRLDVP